MGRRHPLAIPRVSAALDHDPRHGLARRACYLDSPRRTPEQLARFHDADYIAAVLPGRRRTSNCARRPARALQHRPQRQPGIPEIFRRPATACRRHAEGRRAAARGRQSSTTRRRHPSRRPDRASGFCYFNDPVLGILAMLDRGLERIYYVDVECAPRRRACRTPLRTTPRLHTLSITRPGRWPYSGRARIAPAAARSTCRSRRFKRQRDGVSLDEIVLPDRSAGCSLKRSCSSAAPMPGRRPHERPGALQPCALARRPEPDGRGAAAAGARRRRLQSVGGGALLAGVWAVLNGIEPAEAPTRRRRAVLRGLWWTAARARDPPGIGSRPSPIRRARAACGRGCGRWPSGEGSAQARAVTGGTGAVESQAWPPPPRDSPRDSGLNSRAAAPTCCHRLVHARAVAGTEDDWQIGRMAFGARPARRRSSRAWSGR